MSKGYRIKYIMPHLIKTRDNSLLITDNITGREPEAKIHEIGWEAGAFLYINRFFELPEEEERKRILRLLKDTIETYYGGEVYNGIVKALKEYKEKTLAI